MSRNGRRHPGTPGETPGGTPGESRDGTRGASRDGAHGGSPGGGLGGSGGGSGDPAGRAPGDGDSPPSEGPAPLRAGDAAVADPYDRAQHLINGVLMAVLVIGAPTAGLAAGVATHASESRAAAQQAAERYEVTARLTEDADGGTRGGLTSRAPVTWTDKDGAEHTAIVSVASGADRGSTVRVWLDDSGDLSPRPITAASAAVAGWTVGATTLGLFALVVAGARSAAAWAFDRRRFARWEAEWARVGPDWTHRYGE
ncbi:hypothetical protein [Streptomyces sp. NPDC047928]|uniref:Rv1733c family protein n=1 Tax=unclassified Streptomyces TaxID=2593676 RepID=UPI00371B8465